MKVLYELEEKEILKEKLLSDGFKIILARWNRKDLGKIQFVTWLLNPETNVTYRGNYFDKFDEADENYSERLS